MTAHDEELLARFVEGDSEAFVAFYQRHLSAVLGFLLRRTGDPELTADLTAEVFAAALLAAERYRPGERPALAWLYGIAAHKLADSRRRGRVEDEARRRLAVEPLSIDDSDLARVEEMADSGAAEAALLALPPTQRDAVLARVVNERPYAPPARRRERAWRRAASRAVPVLAAVVVALVVIGGALVLLSHRGHRSPSPTNSPPGGGGVGALINRTPRRQLDREVHYMELATRPPR